MLTARRAPKACLSCRSQLLALFEYGFTRPTLPIARPKLRDGSGKRTYLTSKNSQNRTSTRKFSSGLVKLNKDGDRISGGVPHEATSNQEDVTGQSLDVQEKELEETTNFEREVPGDMNDEAALDRMDEEQLEKDFEFGLEFAEELVEAEKVLRTEKGTETLVRSARETFGEVLPEGVLTANEYAIYERLYGKPAKEVDIEEEIEKEMEREQNVLLKENEEGALEEVEYNSEVDLPDESAAGVYMGEELETQDEFGKYRTRKSKKQKELEAKWQLQREMFAALEQQDEPSEFEEDVEDEYDEGEEEFDEEEDAVAASGETIRTHPNTMAGRFGTFPSTINIPKETLVQPVAELLSRTSSKHLVQAAERAFGGPGIPHSASTPMFKKLAVQKHIGLEAGQYKMSEIEADAYIACVLPTTYATVSSVLVETRKRLGRPWLQDLLAQPGGPRILDAGAGGAGILAWRDVVEAEWKSLKSDGLVQELEEIPSGRQTVLTGSNTLRHRVSSLLENTTFLPRLPDYIHASNPETTLDGGGGASQSRKKYDIIVAPHTLLPLSEDYKRKNHVQNLWSLLNPEGGVLILIEKGLPRGFEAIAGARSLLLKHHIASPHDSVVENELQEQDIKGRYTQKETAMIVAPCTNHSQCPMYRIEGLSEGRKDYCHFSQRYIRPPFLQKIVGASSRNHEDVKYSYLVVQRGVDLRQDQEIGEGQEDILQGEEATKAAFSGYESPFNVKDDMVSTELDEDLDITSEEVVEDDESLPEFRAFNLPRAILPPLKRRKHVTLDLCTPSGTLERWTVPKSFSTQAYRDARKSKWGDLWALGAKTRVLREPRLGRKGLGAKGNGLGKKARGRKGKGVNKFDVIMGEEGFEGIKERVGGKVRDGKRTRGGRRDELPRDIGEDDL